MERSAQADIQPQYAIENHEDLSEVMSASTAGPPAYGRPCGLKRFLQPTSGVYPDPDLGEVTMCVFPEGDIGDLSLHTRVLAGGRVVGEAVCPARGAPVFSIKLSEVHVWEPKDHFLYDIEFSLEGKGEQVDLVRSYFGLRRISIEDKRVLLYDVEQEVNGLYTYDRRPKFDPAAIRAINTQQAAIEKGEPSTVGAH